MAKFKNIEEILKTDFLTAHHTSGEKFIKFESDGICDCDKYCIKEGICRAFKITNTEIQTIDLEKMSLFIWKQMHNITQKEWKRNEKLRFFLQGYDQQLDIYCIERILRAKEIYLTHNWVFTYRNGYYGQEIESLTINKELQREIAENIIKVLAMVNLKDKCLFLLELEYGFIVEHLQNCEWRLETISKEEVIFPQVKHLNKVKKSKLYKNRSEKSIMGICTKEGETYRVVDGYNRISQTKNKNISIISAIIS